MGYSESLIEDLISNIDQSIIAFFNKNKKKIGLDTYNIQDYITEQMEIHFQGYTRKEKLSPIIQKINKSKIDKRRYLTNTYLEKLAKPIDDEKNPRHYITTLSDDDYVKLYGSKTFEEALEEHIEEVHTWKKDTQQKLIQFPGIFSCKPKAIADCFNIDLMLAIWNYISTELNGDIGNFTVSYPIDLIDKPFIGGRAHKTELVPSATTPGSYESVIEAEDGQLFMTFLDEYVTNYGAKVLGADFKEAVNCVIKSVDDLTEFMRNKEIVVSVRNVAEAMIDYQYSVNSSNLARAETALVYMYAASINEEGSTENGPFKGFYRLASSLEFYGQGDNRTARIIATDTLADAIINAKVISVNRKVYQQLEDPISKLLSHALKKEQIARNTDGSDRKGKYDYNFFKRCINFPTNNKKTNIPIIKASLEEFYQKQIIIESYRITANTFEITFLPLSDTELDEIIT